MKTIIKIALAAFLVSLPSPGAPGTPSNKRPAKITAQGPGDVPDDVEPPTTIKRKLKSPRIKVSIKRLG